MTRVEAPARLHFGLLAVPIAGEHAPDRLFGGVGLMIDAPRVVLKVKPSDDWSACGPNADRVLAFAQTFTSTLPANEQRPFAIEVVESPEEHAGLGSGTVLALSIAKAIASETGHADWSAMELARRVGRGERSAVGVHGFEHGGLIVEAGKVPGEQISALVARHEFPPEWRIVLVRPRVDERWHGSRERQAFAQLNRQNPTAVLRRIIEERLLPALEQREINEFGEALHEYNARAGEAFAASQGGTYASSAISELVDWFRKQGIRGVGQSSWGPTVFAVTANAETAKVLNAKIESSCSASHITTRASRIGASCS